MEMLQGKTGTKVTLILKGQCMKEECLLKD